MGVSIYIFMICVGKTTVTRNLLNSLRVGFYIEWLLVLIQQSDSENLLKTSFMTKFLFSRIYLTICLFQRFKQIAHFLTS